MRMRGQGGSSHPSREEVGKGLCAPLPVWSRGHRGRVRTPRRSWLCIFQGSLRYRSDLKRCSRAFGRGVAPERGCLFDHPVSCDLRQVGGLGEESISCLSLVTVTLPTISSTTIPVSALHLWPRQLPMPHEGSSCCHLCRPQYSIMHTAAHLTEHISMWDFPA